MGPVKRVSSLSIAIPSSIVADTPHLREKTSKIGVIGRACAIFRVDKIIVFPDFSSRDQSSESWFVSSTLAYMETPQYLRKKLFPFKPIFKYFGVLPPLRTPHHPTAAHVRDLRLGEFREGVVVNSGDKRSKIYIGVEKEAILRGLGLPVGKRVTVKILSLKGGLPGVLLANKEEIKTYWGYNVIVSNYPSGRTIKNEAYDLAVATSKYGTPLMEIAEEMRERWSKARKVLVAFGSPSEGLREILERERLELGDVFDFTVNTIPQQGTETIRTEEAVLASLAALNLMI
ncbi:MAG: RNA methyltransferase [Candidatus Bathyarchaeota archaeon]|nr:RNA methyltransferase [Candidatus Bathyarchaeota archaeon]